MQENTYAHLIEEQRVCIACASIAGIALLALVSFVAVGILDDPPALIRPIFFVFLGLGAFAIAWCRVSADFRKSAARRIVDSGLVRLTDSPESVVNNWTHRAYFTMTICVVSTFAPGSVVFIGVWIPVFNIDPQLAPTLVLGVIAVFLVVSIVGLLQAHRVASNQIGSESPENVQEIPDERPDEEISIGYPTYRQLLDRIRGAAKRTNLLGASLLGQIACVGAGALRGANEVYIAALFSSVLLSGVFLGMYRLFLFFDAERIRRDDSLGKIELSEPAGDSRFLNDSPIESKVFFCSVLVPPLVLFVGILDSFLHFPFLLSATLVVFFLGLWTYALFSFVWKSRQVNTPESG